MGRTFTAQAAITPMWRLTEDEGEAIDETADRRLKLVEPEPNDYATPPDQTKAKLRLSGISEVFKMPSQFSDTPTDNVRVEFLFLKVAGGGNAGQAVTGKRFTLLMTPKVGKKSNLGMLLGRLRERDIELGEEVDIDAYIGTECVATVFVNPKGYVELDPKAIERGKTVLSSALNGGAPSAAAAQKEDPADVEPPDVTDDPFIGDTDDL